MHLHGALASPYVARVVLFAKLKGIELEAIAPEGGIKSAAFLERNPMGKMPVLEVDGVSYAESAVICELLEDLYPGTGGLPGTPGDRARARLVTQVHDTYVAPHLAILFRSMNPTGRDEAALAAARTGFATGMGYLEHHVQAGPFAAGALPSVGDCSLLPGIVIMQKTIFPALGIVDPTTASGNIARWWSAIVKDAVFGAFLPEYRAAVDALLVALAGR